MLRKLYISINILKSSVVDLFSCYFVVILLLQHHVPGRLGPQVVHRMGFLVHGKGVPRHEARGDDQRVGALQGRRQVVHGVFGHVLTTAPLSRFFFFF